MRKIRRQQTIAGVARVCGFGYWSGRDVCVEFRPAPANSGLVFVRADLAGQPRIPAVVENRLETPRRTTLSACGATVEMVEHILAAVAGLHIDNCEIHVDSAEMPGCDGSSLPFVEALQTAGVVTQDALRSRLIVTDVTRVGSEDDWVEAGPPRGPATTLKYRLDYGAGSPISRQTYETAVTPDSFVGQIAPARTFLLEHEARWLRDQGLGQRVSHKDLLVFDDTGPIDNSLRFADECVRHKTLDLIGDLALAGCDLIGHFVAHRSGHRLNAELVRALLAEGQIEHDWRRCA